MALQGLRGRIRPASFPKQVGTPHSAKQEIWKFGLMNAVEIEEAVSALAESPFDPVEFPFQFLEAFGNKPATIKRLRDGHSNSSDLGGVLQRNNIHIAVAANGNVSATLAALKASAATAKAKAQFVLATDGDLFEAEDIESGETVACSFAEFPEHFGFFLPLAGISTVKQVRDSAFDIRATSRLNKLYVELLRDNREWGTAERRPDMNHFMARLIFCFFAEDTDIFSGTGLFTATVDQMSEKDGSNTHEVIAEIFRAMNTAIKDREASGIRSWANVFPYVNGGLFSGSLEVPRFSRIARSYLLHIGSLKWTQINPDIFGSMIQAIADDEERGALGMHYTSRPNILKVLDPLFLDSLREQLEEAGDNGRKLLNLRNRMARIRVFDPACGSGNFLVIAYKEMREIEAEINRRRDEVGRESDIPLTNFRGIELRDFPAEVARLALIIAEFQCDVLYRGQKLALAEFLPLDTENWITCGNSLQVDWLHLMDATGSGGVKLVADDLFETPLDQAQIDFEHQGGETYLCGNPPYVGDKKQAPKQKSDMERIFSHLTKRWKSFDYICGFFQKSADFVKAVPNSAAALVSTNSITQGVQVSEFWPLVISKSSISFAVTSFKWSNLASRNAGVTCVIIGLESLSAKGSKRIFTGNTVMECETISPYMIPGDPTFIKPRPVPISEVAEMLLGNFSKDGGHLICKGDDLNSLDEIAKSFVRPMFGGDEFIKGVARYCFWIEDDEFKKAAESPALKRRFELVSENRLASPKKATAEWHKKPYRFVEIRSRDYEKALIVPIVSSENREFLPVGFLPDRAIINYAFGLYDAPLWNLSILASRIHLVWVAAISGKLETRYRYSNTLCWNTFPLPTLTEKNRHDLTRCAEDILLAREAHFPDTIADLYDPENMPDDLREAHDRNDEVLERIYIGRRFRNDTERLEKLFELYTKMTAGAGSSKKRKVGTSA
jgi:hypothetical protein